MTGLAWFAPSTSGERWVVCSALMILGLVAVAAAVDRVGLRRRPAARHGLWVLTLAAVVAGPLVVAVADRSGLRWTVPLGRSEVAPLAATAVAAVPAEAPPPPAPLAIEVPREVGLPPLGDEISPVGPPPSAEPEAPRSPILVAAPILARPAWGRADGLGLVVLTWLAGVVVGLIRLGRGLAALRRLRPLLCPLEEDVHAAALAEVRDALGMAALPPICTARGVAGPFAAGLIRPYVVVPADLAGSALRDVLIHEVAHVARRDLWVALIQRLAGLVLWPHPAIHLLNRRLNRAREEVCDNFVLRLGDPRGYARTLLTLTERRPAAGRPQPVLGIAGGGWTLADRVLGLLDPERNRMTRLALRARLLTGALLLGVGLPLAVLRFDRPQALAAEPVVTPQADAQSGDPGRPVTGTVVDVAGRPVAGAVVRPIRRDKAPEGASTDADGRFTLTLRGYFLLSEDLIAEADGGTLLGLGKHEESRTAAPAAPVRITLKPSRAVTVRVKDAAGTPVPGAAVETVDFGCYRQGVTGADGAATVRLPEDGHVRWVIAHKGGVGFDYFENYATARPRDEDLQPLPAEVNLTLAGAATVRVKAIGTQGQPVAGVTFNPWFIGGLGKLDHANIGGSQTISVTTGLDGMATFDWLPTRVEPGVPFLVHAEDYSCPDSPIFDSGAATDLTARLLRNTPISGLVRQADGQPARNVLIQAEGRGETNHYCRMNARTDANGRYILKVYPDQEYIVAVADPGVAATSRIKVSVVEGQPREGLDLEFVAGTLVQGQVTRGPGRTPAPGATVTLIQKDQANAPRPQIRARNKPPRESASLVRWVVTDEQGRYKLGLGPGHFEVFVHDSSDNQRDLTITSRDAATITHDVHLAEPEKPTQFAGRVVEKRAGGNRPIAGALVEAVGFRHALGFSARADADGRFRGGRRQDGPLVVYARSPDGTLAGFSTFPGDVTEGAAVVGPAAKVLGRVVDRDGRPRADYRVQIRLDSGTEFETSGRVFRQIRTDAQGRYTAEGVPVGIHGEASISLDIPPFAASIQPFEVKGEDAVELPDLAIPANRGKRAEPKVAAPAVPPARRIAPTVTTRAEVEDLVKAIGRDAATPELVDRVSIPFLPQNTWPYDLARVRRLVIDDRFVGRVDAASLNLLKHPADTETLIAVALINGTLDDAELTGQLERLNREHQQPVIVIEGTADDAATGRPVAGAIVQTRDALTRADEAGRFALRTRPNPGRMIQYYVAADGYGLREVMLAPAELKPQVIHLTAAVPVEGQVVDPAGKPIAGAKILAWVDRKLTLGRAQQPRDGGNNARILIVQSDERGMFSVPSIPPFEKPFSLDVSHPDFEAGNIQVVEPTTAAPLVVRLQPGAVVGGMVVDEQGRGVAGAWVHLRPPASDRDAATVATDDQGRYRFGNVRPGRWNLVIEPAQLAPVQVAVVASLDRPVENQVVVPPGLYVRGQVVGDDGKAVAGASVGWVKSASDPGFSFNRMTKADGDGSFKLGPLPPGEFAITGLAESPRREGKVTAKANQTDALIRLAPAPLR